jgi:regulator of sigma E protease
MEDLLRILATLLLFLVVLVPLVLVHELGHFLAARAAGVRVLEFGIGIPPRARVLRAKGETLITLNWLPLGGFVRLEGEDGNTSDPRSFAAKPLIVQLLILFAGVVMNVIFALVVFVGISWASPPVGVTVPAVQPDSPASAAGIRPGDTILSIDGQTFGPPQYGGGILAAIHDDAGKTVTLGIRHADGTVASVQVTLRSQAQIDEDHGALGISRTETQPFEPVDISGTVPGPTFGSAVASGVDQLGIWSGLIVTGLGDLVHSFVTNPGQAPPAAGPIGIAQQIGDVFFNVGPIATLYLAAVLSINLAVVNVIPYPPLDGGRMLVVTVKRLFGGRVSRRAEGLTYLIGAAFLFALLIWISGFDILRLGGGT